MRVTSCNRCHRRKCVCKKASTGAFATETVNKVITIPVEGAPGQDGDKLVFMYQLSDQNTIPPAIGGSVNPGGWSPVPLQTTEALPYRWVSQGYVNAEGTELVVGWSVPVVDLDAEPISPESDDLIFDI